MNYPCAKFEDFRFSCFDFIVRIYGGPQLTTFAQTTPVSVWFARRLSVMGHRTDRHNTHTYRITDADDCYTDVTTVCVSSYYDQNHTHFYNNIIIFNVRQKTDARYSYRLDVCLSVRLSVRPSVTRWYCVETAQPIVKLSSLPGSPMILVLWGPNFSRNSNGNTPNGGVKCKGVEKSCNFRPISHYS